MDPMWDILQDFIIDYCEYLPENIPQLSEFPTPNEFLTDYVLTNLPFVVRCNESQHFPAVSLWQDKKYMRKMMQNKMVTVAVSPDGRADSIVDDRFMIPEERKMSFDEFYTEFQMPHYRQVFYLQKQNNNFIEEFSPLVKDVGSDIPWATEAFSSNPDAVNIWMGDHRSVTSLHKDHYENIYCVITGEKTFYLYPPVAIGWMPYQKCKKYQWYYERDPVPKGTWHMKDLNEEVKWILPSHKPETPKHYTMFDNTKCYTMAVRPGDVLYLPALWFHEVMQTDECIAVNYWYDMKFDMKYPFLKLLSKLSRLRTERSDASVDIQMELEDDLLWDLHQKHKKEGDKLITFRGHKRVEKKID